MAFPSNPSPGDQATVGGRLYRWDGAVWSFLEAVSPHAATHASGGGDAITIDAGQVSGGTLAANLLPAATTSSRGAVQVGSGLAVDNGVLSNTGVPGATGLFNAYSAAANFPAPGQANTLYVAIDTSRTYQYTGGVYVELGPGATVVAATLPAAPTSLTADGGNGSATLTWSAPTNTGGSAITDYSIQYSANGGTTWSTFSDSISAVTSSVITGLTNGTAYTFRVAAVNVVGTGSYSSTTTATPSGSVPGQPTILAAFTSYGSATLWWNSPSSNGGSAVFSYRVQTSTDGATWTTASATFLAATSATISNLSDATTYYFRVAAINANGIGAYSSVATATTPTSVPTAPRSVTAYRYAPAGMDTLAIVSWLPPSSQGGSAITAYPIQTSLDGTNWADGGLLLAKNYVWGQGNAALGIPAYSQLYIRVAATNSAGTGPYSSAAGPV
ncbi:fibronectin type III domain-containing protein [bacterium]|nr:fibronectin type III domain-containing protein [bacterium]